MVKTGAVALLAALLVWPGVAAAQVETKTANVWTVQGSEKGCRVVVSVGAMYGFANPSRVTWSGGCARGLAEGAGEMRVYFLEEGMEIYADYHGRFSGGLMQGDWKFASWEKAGSEWAGSGIYNYQSFQDGCMVKNEGAPVRSPCRMIAGRNAAANAADKPAPGSQNITPFSPRR